VVKALDRSFQDQGLSGNQIVLVSDIGCSGLFDTFFHTHALHGLHGRALTYATGLKMVRPDLHVVVTMGDGGLGIGGAHLLAACRRNVDLTLLILNNFNFGMTGGQFSATTPAESTVGSGFLNSVERPMDACRVLEAAGAPFVLRTSAYAKDLSRAVTRAMGYPGFAALDIWGVCPGRYMKRNTISPQVIDRELSRLPAANGTVPANERQEYTEAVRERTGPQSDPEMPPAVAPICTAPQDREQGLLILGAAGQRVVTAGELAGLAGMCAGLQASQKNDYPITVLTGHSVSEVILSPEAIDYTGLSRPSAVMVLAEEGVVRRREVFATLPESSLVLRAVPDLEVPPTQAEVVDLDLKARGIHKADHALASLAVMAQRKRMISTEMLKAAIDLRFSPKIAEASRKVVDAVYTA
jgi:pyruvate/2-oxoacid:ferredoxin oxidoreductase beta subunit/Pyruvate/2-oxoacid:ferredoxin oxidoreductase gamma subunit